MAAGKLGNAALAANADTVLYTARWQQVLLSMGHRAPLSGLARQNFVGVFFNNFAPSMLGQDAVKTYYLGRETLLTGGDTKMAAWRKTLFAYMSRNAWNATTFFGIPPGRVVELGSQVRL